MEESSAKDVTRETANNPCSFLEEALRAVLKCLGVDAKVQDDSPSSDQKDEKINNGTNTQDNSSTTEQVSDPPSATTDPEADPLSTSSTETFEEVGASTILVLNAPPRPSLSTGSGPQIN